MDWRIVKFGLEGFGEVGVIRDFYVELSDTLKPASRQVSDNGFYFFFI